jgi:hypothetical protein
MTPRNLFAGALLALTMLACAAPAHAIDTDQWLHWNGTPPEATIRSLDFFGGTLYASGENEGVYQSLFPVGPWNVINQGLEAPNAKSVFQVKAAPNGVLYAATSAGLFSRPANGSTWSPVGQGTGERKLNMGGVQSIMINDPTATDMTVAIAGAAGPGVYYSSDAGAHWDKASGMPAGEHVFMLTANTGGTPMYAAADNGVYVSLNFGRTWTLMSDGIPPGQTVFRVAVPPGAPGNVYAATGSSVYRFNPLTLSWIEIEGSDDQRLKAGQRRAIMMAPSLPGKFGPHRALVGTSHGVYATLDDGDHWKPMSGATFNDATLPMDQRIVESLGIGFTTPALMAGTRGYGIFSIALQPIFQAPITISGSAGVGHTLTAVGTDSWTGTKPFWFTYQWSKCRKLVSDCVPAAIAGATSATYTIPEDDENKTMMYQVTVTGRNIVLPGSVHDDSDILTLANPALPTSVPRPGYNNTGPSLSPTANQVGTPEYGQKYTANPGQWILQNGLPLDENAMSFSYKWERCNPECSEILGPDAHGATYTTTPAEIAGYVRGWVRGSYNGVASDWWLAGNSATINNRKPVNTVKPAIVGDPYLGVVLSSAAGGWNGWDIVKYQRTWLRCEADGLGCNPILGETGVTHKLGAADLGKRLQLKVEATAYDKNFNRVAEALSAQTPVITDPSVVPPPPGDGGGGGVVVPPPLTPPVVKILAPKVLKPGKKLSVPKTYAGFTTLKFRWLRNGKPIKRHARRATYRITRKDRGKKLSCRITLAPAAGGTPIVVKTKPVKIPRRRR